jgi:enamine deaminase RidA (YjgF/YER057c/UK114 family)
MTMADLHSCHPEANMNAIRTGLPALKLPIEWAVMSDSGVIYTAQIAIHEDGRLELGDAGAQMALIMENLAKTLRAAGSDLSDLLQVLIYMTDPADGPSVNQVYAQYVKTPYPNRASFYVSALAIPGLRVEVVAYAQGPTRCSAASTKPITPSDSS